MNSLKEILLSRYGCILAFCLVFVSFASPQDLQLNEVMTKNNSFVEIGGDFYDWIEIYNPTNDAIELSNYFLSDRESDPYKYQLPAVTLAAQSHFILLCSGLNQFQNGHHHTNFSLNNNEAILLSTATEIIESIAPNRLPENLSFGRVTEDQSILEILQFPTPGSNNHSAQNNSLFASHTSQIYYNDFYLKLNAVTSDSIYFSLNNYDPLAKPTLFNDSLLIPFSLDAIPDISIIPSTSNQSISYHAWEAPQNTPQKCYSLSYASYKNGIRTSPVYHQTFIPASNRINFDVVTITSDSIGLFSHDSGILVPGANYNNANPEWTGNFFQEGADWERNAHFQLISENGDAVFSQPVKIKIAGGKTRQSAQKSLAIQADAALSNDILLHPFFDHPNTERNNAVTLKTTMGDWGTQTMIKDVLAHQISKDLRFHSQDYKFVDVYINGVYFGVQTIRERFSPKNFLLEVDELDALHILNPSNLVTNYGSAEDFESILNFIQENSLSLDENFNYLKSKFNLNSLIDYYCAELFFGNYDWPINNIKVIQSGTSEWNWLFFDLDGAFPDASIDMFAHVTNENTSTTYPNPPSSTLIIRKLLENKTFKTNFIQRYTELLHTTFSTAQTLPILTELKNQLSPSIPDQIERWGYPSSLADWEQDISNLSEFLTERPCYVINNMIAFFKNDNLQTACDLKWDESNTVLIYPNPTSDFLHIIYRNQTTQINTIQIYNHMGALVKEIDPTNQTFHYSISLAELASGVYSVVLNSNYKSTLNRFTKF
ncbi:MAG: CotH kinase family protein [Lishizhenia sp.]